jgi:PilZ domain
MQERRKKPRLSVNLQVCWDGLCQNYPARVTNLSETGCYVDSIAAVSVGGILAFRVKLPNGEWHFLEGEVMHYTPNVGFGLHFIDLDDEQLEPIRALLNATPTVRARLDAGLQAVLFDL